MTADQTLSARVTAELAYTADLNHTAINVANTGDVVTLSGTVDSYAQKRSAARAAQRVSGVHGLANDLDIRPAPRSERTDAQIARAALDRLAWSWVKALHAVQVTVERGRVTLDGDLTWDYQRQAAQDAVSDLLGVRGVTNRITLTPSSTPDEVASSIKDAFLRRSEQDAREVMVSVSGGQVTLSGRTYSWAERERAANAAWSAVGVTGVDNHLKVTAPAWPAL